MRPDQLHVSICPNSAAKPLCGFEALSLALKFPVQRGTDSFLAVRLMNSCLPLLLLICPCTSLIQYEASKPGIG